jgi:hypothetical protein
MSEDAPDYETELPDPSGTLAGLLPGPALVTVEVPGPALIVGMERNDAEAWSRCEADERGRWIVRKRWFAWIVE